MGDGEEFAGRPTYGMRTPMQSRDEIQRQETQYRLEAKAVIARRLHERRDELDVTPFEVAKAIRVSPRTYTNWENPLGTMPDTHLLARFGRPDAYGEAWLVAL